MLGKGNVGCFIHPQTLSLQVKPIFKKSLMLKELKGQDEPPWGGRSAQPWDSNTGVSSHCIVQDWRGGNIYIYTPSPILLGSHFSYLMAQLLTQPNKTFLRILLVIAMTCPAWLQLAAKAHTKKFAQLKNI